jgi:hypothetical protein
MKRYCGCTQDGDLCSVGCSLWNKVRSLGDILVSPTYSQLGIDKRRRYVQAHSEAMDRYLAHMKEARETGQVDVSNCN